VVVRIRTHRPNEPNQPGDERGSKTFLLGAGAQKAGTTWLYRYLQASPQFAHGYRKEYHVFDSRDLPSEAWMRDRILKLAEDSVAAARRGEPADAEVLHRASMYADPAFYFDYFAGLLRRSPDIRLAADLTPGYALLSVERLRELRSGFEDRRVRPVAIMLLRDPVDRIWSQVRMQHQRQPEKFEVSAEETLQQRYADPQYARRNDYHRTIEALDASFGPGGQVHYAFYERLFERSEVEAICDFVGIDVHTADFAKRHNESTGSPDSLAEGTIRAVATHYREVYAAVAERFPQVDLGAVWPNSRLL